MSWTKPQFRAAFPEFASNSTWPDAAIDFQTSLAVLLLNKDRFASTLDIAQQLFVAHHLVIEKAAQQDANAGGLPGLARGPITAESLDKVNTSYDSGSFDPNAGHLNLTIYGMRLSKLMRMFGAGPIQVNC